MSDISDVLFVLANLAIVVGYVFLAAVVVPRMTIHLGRTRIGGIGFFLTCALTHLEMVFHYVFASHHMIGEVYSEWHMLLIHIPQAIFVWMFVTGLYTEIVRWGQRGMDPECPPQEQKPEAVQTEQEGSDPR